MANSPALTIVLPPGWPRPRGYSQGIRVPMGRELVFVAGQVGWDEQERFVAPGFAAQFEQALRNCAHRRSSHPPDISRSSARCRAGQPARRIGRGGALPR